MDFGTLVRVLVRGWRVVVACTLIGALVGFASTRVAPKVYESAGLLYVTAIGAEDATSLAQGTRYVQDQMKSYPIILTSPSIVAAVISERQLQTSPHELSQRITSDIPLDSTIMRVGVRASSPEEAQKTASVLIRRFVAAVNRLEQRPGSQASSVRLTLIDPPSTPSTPVSPSLRINLLVAMVGGLIVGSAIALALASLRRRPASALPAAT